MHTKSFNFNSFKQSGERFLSKLTMDLVENGVLAESLKIDHLCFRVATLKEYDFFKTCLCKHGELLAEAFINGRPISTFRLSSSFQTKSHEVPLLELPAPKDGFFHKTGFEHAEFVIKESFSAFSSKYPDLNFAQGGNSTLNPELSLKLQGGLHAKFHQIPLDRVIEIEEAKIKDVIFDLDGTLIKSRENIHEINRIVFSKALGREISKRESIENFYPEFSKLFKAYDISCTLAQSEVIASWGMVASQFSHELFDGALETLHSLSELGFNLHLWTARDEASARKTLKEHGVEDLFKTLSFATGTNSKPHPSSLRFDWQTAEKNRIIVVGDSSTDMHGARSIGAIRGAALWDTYACSNSLIKSGAEIFFYEISGFKEWLTKTTRKAGE